MAYLTQQALEALGFKKLGKNVKISDKASIYNHDVIEIGDHSRIDDFCVVSGRVSIGRFCHISTQCLIAGGEPGVFMADFCGLAYGTKVFSQSDDYSGATMVSSLVDKKYKNEFFSRVVLEKHVIVGAGSIIFPGVEVKEGCSIGAMTLVNKSTHPWGIYFGSPARRIKERKRDILTLESQFLKEREDDSLQ
nr:acyltransferase [uncultured Halomonas sp.]